MSSVLLLQPSYTPPKHNYTHMTQTDPNLLQYHESPLKLHLKANAKQPDPADNSFIVENSKTSNIDTIIEHSIDIGHLKQQDQQQSPFIEPSMMLQSKSQPDLHDRHVLPQYSLESLDYPTVEPVQKKSKFYEMFGHLLEKEYLTIMTLSLLWYGSSAVTNNLAKEVFQVVSLPVTLTYIQFAFVAFFCLLFGSIPASNFPTNEPILITSFDLRLKNMFALVGIQIKRFFYTIRYWIDLGLGTHEQNDFLFHKEQSRMLCNTKIKYPKKEILMQILPLSGFLISGHIFSSVALSHVPVSFVHTIKALSPLFTVFIFRTVFHTYYSSFIYISLIPLTLGVMLACSSELSFNLMGLLCSLLSTLIFVVQNIVSKRIFEKRKLDKLNMLFYSSLLSFLLMTPIWFYTEAGFLIQHLEQVKQASWMILLNGLSHFCQNVFAFSILALCTPVTYSIASLLKRIVVITVSILWFGQEIRNVQLFGILMTFLGLWMYQQAKFMGGTEKENVVEKRGEEMVAIFVEKKSPPPDDRQTKRFSF